MESFYVVGDVRNPGAFELAGPTSRPLLLTQAIAQAGGANQTAKLTKGTVLRYDSNGKREDVAFNFKDILAGKQPDVRVGPNDIVFIPGSKIKTIQYGLLGVVPTAAQNRARSTPVFRPRE